MSVMGPFAEQLSVFLLLSAAIVSLFSFFSRCILVERTLERA
jgi:hypothetical protein